jgi:hypothetical protein
LRHFFALLAITLFCAAQAQQQSFSAQFKSLENGEGVIYARVFTLGGEAKLTNVDGLVELNYAKGATIIVTHLSFDSLQINTADFEGRT